MTRWTPVKWIVLHRYRLRLPLIALMAVVLTGCADPNEHFCAKYQFFHDELTGPEVMPLIQIREQLQDDLNNPKADFERITMALFVLDDIEQKRIRHNETPTEFCFRTQRWSLYQPHHQKSKKAGN